LWFGGEEIMVIGKSFCVQEGTPQLEVDLQGLEIVNNETKWRKRHIIRV
jgi:hypothetical protein